MQAQWVCHDKAYWRKLCNLDGTALPIVTAGISDTMMDAVKDCVDFAHKHTLPTLLITAGKDKIVDNVGAREFHKRSKTPADKK
jgi:alpha-beta hydrolase superfamily lysophospholipase